MVMIAGKKRAMGFEPTTFSLGSLQSPCKYLPYLFLRTFFGSKNNDIVAVYWLSTGNGGRIEWKQSHLKSQRQFHRVQSQDIRWTVRGQWYSPGPGWFRGCYRIPFSGRSRFPGHTWNTFWRLAVLSFKPRFLSFCFCLEFKTTVWFSIVL